MATREIGIILHGATGGIGSFQHLRNSLAPIRAEGGLPAGGDTIMPKPLLAGRNAERLAAVAAENGGLDWTTDLDAALRNPEYPVFFDAAATHLRFGLLKRAIEAGKHIYAEKPVAPTAEDGLALLRAAEARGLKHGAVEDKLFLPGFRKLHRLVDSGFFGRIIGFRIEFGWWVFDGVAAPSQRPSWNYRKSSGGGLISDMHPHWRYIVEGMLGPIKRVAAMAWTGQTVRADESGDRFGVDVEDNAHTLLEMESGARGAILASWSTRVRRDDLVAFQIDGTGGSAVAGLRRCWKQPARDTPAIRGFLMGRDADTMNVNVDYREGWQEVQGSEPYKNPYRFGWEGFIRHVAAGEPFYADLAGGIRDVQLAEACQRSAAEGRWMEMPLLRRPGAPA
ncbi:MAG: Gfo/Idh/MocA family oxidoreductase [Candidatus Tectomicrobia bacterium]|uniref:Gfo/Idh/MocA family oxidoreductase n=1 Tax=Tectimicrobiota bacterium TaxID=2528274 RepID=A0A932MP62_UNCTE|nr:Gfo/Idh/MocA family oxidoreductase [Candidatus Tectomicrobia bacterium]